MLLLDHSSSPSSVIIAKIDFTAAIAAGDGGGIEDLNQVKSTQVSDTVQQSNSSHDLNLLCACLEQLMMHALLHAKWPCSTCKVHSRMYSCRMSMFPPAGL